MFLKEEEEEEYRRFLDRLLSFWAVALDNSTKTTTMTKYVKVPANDTAANNND